MYVHSSETKRRGGLPVTIRIKSGKNETFNTHCGRSLELGRFAVDGGNFAEIIILLIYKETFAKVGDYEDL